MRQKLGSVAPRKFFMKNFFFRNLKKSKIFQKKSDFEKKIFFIETLRGVTEASFCRMKLLRCLFFQELPILCVWNKIKLLRNF